MVDWEQLVADHGPAVWRSAYRLTGDRADADDCFQETFAAALALTRASPEPVRHWRALLVRLAVARGVDRLRHRVRHRSRESADPDLDRLADARPDDRPPDAAMRAELADRLRLALSRLPPKQADAFCLTGLEGWSYRQAADQLGVTTDHVGVLVHRARAALKRQLDSILSAEVPTRPARRPRDPTPERGEA